MRKHIYLLLLLLSVTVFGQQKQLTTSIDKTKNKIGAEFQLTIKTTVDTVAKVVFPNSKNFGALEVIHSYSIDTVKKNDRYELIKKYGLTQFDSGKYTIPSIKILINNQPFLSDSIRVEVANIAVDTLKQKMFDIKPITEVATSNSWIWESLLALFLLAGIGFFVYWFIKIRKNKKVQEEVFKTPIEKATSLLNTLEKKELWQKGEIKSYYSELTDIARNYIEEAIDIPAMESTTAELILGLRLASLKKKMELSQETIENLERVLKQADLVKFAKSKPLDFEITEDRKKIEKTIVTLDKSIPLEVAIEEDILLNDLQKQKQLEIQLKKQKKRKLFIIVVLVVFLLSATASYFIATKGFVYVKDTVFGNQTKELLEGVWVTSDYGNPNVKIETPKVLVRIDLAKTLPNEGMALLKEMQSFSYGGLSDDFYLLVSTLRYKQESEIDLSKSIESSLQIIASQGAENMLVKQDEFETKEGIKGRRGYGTFSIINTLSKTSTKYYYELVLFGQEGGLQQILISYKEGDLYANQISERILKSVAFNKITE